MFTSKLVAAKLEGIIEWVPAYNTVAIYYRPETISYSSLVEKVNAIYAQKNKEKPIQPLVYKIPVLYNGPDLSYIAACHNLRENEVISLHSNKEYLVYMMGFVPGFPYLGGLSSKLAVPRLEHPRPSVAPGSVGIGGNQTGIYPSEVPSGWRILGITPVELFDRERSSPILFSAGNYIKFHPIDEQEYARIKKLVKAKDYIVQTYKRGENNEGD
ncbi:5-oxoprolinase subunit PxpB [Neobacillus bataviensis]|uniref:5-oxoprolinase subunit PxpB n=1 Tax=Neobacillus bataviensis TaxID=220685 RepID=UPI001CBEEFE2|nr:5-oxoprolinase subunit PxpB [Neobacillus bataviensis]